MFKYNKQNKSHKSSCRINRAEEICERIATFFFCGSLAVFPLVEIPCAIMKKCGTDVEKMEIIGTVIGVVAFLVSFNAAIVDIILNRILERRKKPHQVNDEEEYRLSENRHRRRIEKRIAKAKARASAKAEKQKLEAEQRAARARSTVIPSNTMESAQKELFQEFWTSANEGIPFEEFKKTGLAGTGAYSSEDLCTGICGGTRFRLADVSMQKSKGSQTYCFNGVWLDVPFDSGSIMGTKGELLVVPKKFRTKAKFKTANFLFKKRRHKVYTGDETFDREFTCMTYDRVLACDYLTDKFMKRMLRLEEEYDGQMIFMFANGRLYVLLNDRERRLDPPEVLSSHPKNLQKKEATGHIRARLKIVPEVLKALGIAEIEDETVDEELNNLPSSYEVQTH